MKRRSRLRRVVIGGGLLVCLLVATAWLLTARRQIWYAWNAEILTPYDTRLCGIADGGVIYRAFHPHSMDEHLLAEPGWHMAAGSRDLGFTKPTISVRQCRTMLWIPLWVILVAVGIPTMVVWRWPRQRVRGTCPTCGYNLTGNVSGQCPECGRQTGAETK